MQGTETKTAIMPIDDWNLVGDDIEIWFYLEGNDNPPFISVDKDAFDKWIYENDNNWSEAAIPNQPTLLESQYRDTKDYQMSFEEYSKDMDFMKECLSEYLIKTFFNKILNNQNKKKAVEAA